MRSHRVLHNLFTITFGMLAALAHKADMGIRQYALSQGHGRNSKALRRGTPGAFGRRHNLVIDGNGFGRGPRPETWWKQARLDWPENRLTDGSEGRVYTRPDSVVQRPVNSNSKDRKGYRRFPFGGITSERAA